MQVLNTLDRIAIKQNDIGVLADFDAAHSPGLGTEPGSRSSSGES
jgi:hypothetical protein